MVMKMVILVIKTVIKMVIKPVCEMVMKVVVKWPSTVHVWLPLEAYRYVPHHKVT